MRSFILSLLSLLIVSSCGDSKTSATPAENSAPSSAATKPESRSAANTPTKDYTEQLFQNPFDADAVYFLSQKEGTPAALSVLIKRDSQDGTQYSRWQFNCVEQTARNLGVAASLQELEKSVNSMPSAVQHYELKSRLGAIATAVCPH